MNEYDLINEIISIAKASLDDAEKVLKNNKTAGVRLRKNMQQIRSLSKQIRDSIQDRKKGN